MIGVLGVGAIAEAMVTGWCDGVGEPPTIVLSPRGRDRSASLAGRFPTVEVAAHNQEVLDRAATVVVALRPQDVAATLGSLTFSRSTRWSAWRRRSRSRDSVSWSGRPTCWPGRCRSRPWPGDAA